MIRIAQLHDGPLPAAWWSPSLVVSPAHGGIASFVGVVRDATRGRAVLGLTYHAYRAMAELVLARVAEEAAAAHDEQLAWHVAHAVGPVAPGEAGLVVHTASAHRAAAFAACRQVVERLKQDLPVWKHERFADGGEAWGKGS